MLYKTITLELIHEDRALRDRLRRERTTLQELDRLASELKTMHEQWKERLRRSRPEGDPTSLACEALELALEDLRRLSPFAATDE